MGSMPEMITSTGIPTSWSRLVRFIAREDYAEHIGEPLDVETDVGAALAAGEDVRVRAFTGTSVLAQDAQPTSSILTISRLLRPLSSSEVGTIRCIGLNYRNHAKEMNLEPMGLTIVAATAIPEPGEICLRAVLNAKTMQQSLANDMIFSIPEIVGYLSQGTKLEPGTAILTGTSHGIGVSKEPKVWLKDGDDSKIVMSHGLGSLVTPVSYEEAPKVA